MPIYEYVCQDCQHEFDAMRSMKDADAPIACKHCQSSNTRRALSLCYSQSGGHALAGSNASGGCGNCSGGGSCGSCGCSH